MKKRTFAIIGLGLMGGSLGLALRRHFPKSRVIGVSRSAAKVKRAKRQGIITGGFTNLAKGVRSADMVFICTPVSLIAHYVQEIDRYARAGCIVTDVGSTKEFLMKWAAKKRFRAIRFIGSHPMAGSHETGLRHAKKDLYDNSLVFITPLARDLRYKKAVRELAVVWKTVAGSVFICNPKKHDQIVAQASHLPHLVASLLTLSVEPSRFQFASSGFSDTTRIAQGDPDIWYDIIASNRKNLIKALLDYRKRLDKLLASLRSNDSTGIKNTLKRAASRRQSL